MSGETLLNSSSLAEAIRVASDELLSNPRSTVSLNRVASRLDRLGRRLHALGCLREQEIGECLTAAVPDLMKAQRRPEPDREKLVRSVLAQLQAARAFASPGTPAPSIPGGTETAEPEVAVG